jgi:transmembrane sensor
MTRRSTGKTAMQAAECAVRSALSSNSPRAGTSDDADEQAQSLRDVWDEVGGLKHSASYADLLGAPTWREHLAMFRSRLSLPRPRFAIPALSMMALAAVAFYALIPRSERYESGDQARTFVLPDQSSIILAPSSRIDFSMRDGKRLAQLVGQAQFSVAHDADHPFLIQAGEARVRVLGTRFNLAYRKPCTQLSVLSGTVSIQARAMTERKLHAGEATVNIDAGQSPFSCLVSNSHSPVLHWSYVDAPLSRVIDDLRQFYPQKIVVKSSDLAREHVTIAFSINEIGSIIHTIPEITDANIKTGSDGTVYLYR